MSLFALQARSHFSNSASPFAFVNCGALLQMFKHLSAAFFPVFAFTIRPLLSLNSCTDFSADRPLRWRAFASSWDLDG